MKTDQHHGLPAAGRGLCGEGRHVRQLRALAAMEERRPAAARAMPGWIRKSWRTIFLKVRELYQKEGGKFPDPDPERVVAVHDPVQPVARRRSRRRSTARRSRTSPTRRRSSTIKAGQQLPGFAWLKDDGTTLCGNWLYCGSWTEAGSHDRSAAAPTILRASAFIRTGPGRGRRTAACCTTARRAISTANRGIRRGGRSGGTKRKQKWVGNDVPDFKADSKPERSHGPVHHESRGRRPHLRAARRRWPTGRSPNTTSRSRARSRIRCIPNQSNNPVVKTIQDADMDKYGDGRARDSTSSARPTG